jgi:hypothetical protein
VIDLRGRPSFRASSTAHVHLLAVARKKREVDLTGLRSSTS